MGRADDEDAPAGPLRRLRLVGGLDSEAEQADRRAVPAPNGGESNVSDLYTDPETGVIYWRDENGILRPRVLTNADGDVISYEQAAGWFSGRVGVPEVGSDE